MRSLHRRSATDTQPPTPAPKREPRRSTWSSLPRFPKYHTPARKALLSTSGPFEAIVSHIGRKSRKFGSIARNCATALPFL